MFKGQGFRKKPVRDDSTLPSNKNPGLFQRKNSTTALARRNAVARNTESACKVFMYANQVYLRMVLLIEMRNAVDSAEQVDLAGQKNGTSSETNRVSRMPDRLRVV